jgi:hypothetical protein
MGQKDASIERQIIFIIFPTPFDLQKEVHLSQNIYRHIVRWP